MTEVKHATNGEFNAGLKKILPNVGPYISPWTHGVFRVAGDSERDIFILLVPIDLLIGSKTTIISV